MNAVYSAYFISAKPTTLYSRVTFQGNNALFRSTQAGHFVVRENARQYQMEGSGDADLSFDLNGVSFDDVNEAGQLVDRKWGHADAVFNKDGTVKNTAREASILAQAERQLDAVGRAATKIQWEVSSELGADGIRKLFDREGINIEVLWIPQKDIVGK